MPKSKKFKKLLKATQKQYAGKEVPKAWRAKYGKQYSKEEAKSIAYATARKLGWKV